MWLHLKSWLTLLTPSLCVCVVQVAREPYSDRLWDTGKNTHVWRSLREQQRRATSSSPTGRVGKCACRNGLVRGCVRASQGSVCVAVCPCLVSMWESFHSRRTKPLTLPGRNQACFSRSCGACAFHSFLSLLCSFFSVSSWFIAQVVFHPLHPICSSVPAYLLCVPTDGFVCLCVCGPSCLDLTITLRFAEEIPAVWITLFATGLSPEHVCFILTQWLPVDASIAWQKFRPQLDNHIRWRQINPLDTVLARRVCSKAASVCWKTGFILLFWNTCLTKVHNSKPSLDHTDHLWKMCHLEIMNNNRRSLRLRLCISAYSVFSNLGLSRWMIIWTILIIYKVVYKIKRSMSQNSNFPEGQKEGGNGHENKMSKLCFWCSKTFIT